MTGAAAGPQRAALALAPVLFNWPAEQWRDFYFRIADEADVDTVSVGEVVCAKRWPFHAPELPAVIDRLRAAGKEVMVSTLALVMSRHDEEVVADMAAMTEVMVEANDLSALATLAGRPHAIGAYVNVYNEATLGYLARRGAVRICLPVELPRASVEALAQAGFAEVEVQVFGRMPLALSARCYHARAHGLTKDSCQYVCAADADGMEVADMDGMPLVAVNGTQTLSNAYLDLGGEIEALRAAGVRRFRLSPQDVDMVAVAALYRDVLDGARDGAEAQAALAALCPDRTFANGFLLGRPGMARVGAVA